MAPCLHFPGTHRGSTHQESPGLLTTHLGLEEAREGKSKNRCPLTALYLSHMSLLNSLHLERHWASSLCSTSASQTTRGEKPGLVGWLVLIYNYLLKCNTSKLLGKGNASWMSQQFQSATKATKCLLFTSKWPVANSSQKHTAPQPRLSGTALNRPLPQVSYRYLSGTVCYGRQ